MKHPGYQLLSLVPPSVMAKRSSRTAIIRLPPTPSFYTKLCLLPSPIDAYITYGFMAIFSVVCIVVAHFSCWRRSKRTRYVELSNLWKDEESVGGEERRRIWRSDIQGIAEDCVSLFVFVGLGFVLQIVGVY